MRLELGHVDRKYASLRVLAADRLGPLMASLAEAGQQTPVLVVDGGTGPVLIDGYRRLAALERLGRDTVEAVELELSEADALVLRHRMAAGERRSALEDGWLLRELVDGHGVSQRELGARLQRSASWVCRRLGLVRDLPESVQELVRKGEVPAHAAMRCLLPLARANAEAMERLAKGLDGQRWTSREVEALYVGWRKSAPEQREAIESKPRLYCRALAEVCAPLPVEDIEAKELAAGIQRLGNLAWRMRAVVKARCKAKGSLEPADVLAGLWNDAERRVGELREAICQGLHHAG